MGLFKKKLEEPQQTQGIKCLASSDIESLLEYMENRK